MKTSKALYLKGMRVFGSRHTVVLLLLAAFGAVGFWLLACGDKGKGAVGSSSAGVLHSIGQFNGPLAVVQPKGDTHRLFVVEQSGKVWLLVGGRKQAVPFLNVSNKISSGGEQGLLGLAFSPDYVSSGKFYVDYTNTNGDTRVMEYTRSTSNPNLANPASARTVLAQSQPQSNHNGGNLQFGPDGYLYIGLGDGGGGGDQHGAHGNAQNLGVLLGKILRINPKKSGTHAYSIPADNPFIKRSGARGEIWAYGLRNPWRFSFDRLHGGLAIGDVGQNKIEEINWAAAPGRGKAANYGWRVWEGTSRYTPSEIAVGAISPVAQYSHLNGNCSVTGGYVVRDSALTKLYGRYLFADWCSGRIWAAQMRTGKLAAIVSLLPISLQGISSFGEDQAGHIYLASNSSGKVYRLDPK